MEFSIARNTLQNDLSFVQGVVERKNTIPILANIVIETVGEGSVRFIATDLDVTIRCDAEADTITTPGALCVNARKLFDIVRLMPEGIIKFRKEANDWITLKCGSANFKLLGAPRESFPELPENKSVPTRISASVIRDFIGRSIFAITQEESRYTMSGAKFILDSENAKMITTDGHRMVYVATLLPIEGSGEDRIDVLIPRKALAEMNRLTAAHEGDVRIGADEKHLYFEAGSRLLISRLLTGQFPNYELVMPKSNDKNVVLDAVQLNQAIRLVATVADDRTHGIQLTLESGGINIRAQSAEQGEGEQSIEAEYDGDPIKIGFNAIYLQEFLSVIGEKKVSLDFKDSNSQVQLRPLGDSTYDCRYVVMPLRI